MFVQNEPPNRQLTSSGSCVKGAGLCNLLCLLLFFVVFLRNVYDQTWKMRGKPVLDRSGKEKPASVLLPRDQFLSPSARLRIPTVSENHQHIRALRREWHTESSTTADDLLGGRGVKEGFGRLFVELQHTF